MNLSKYMDELLSEKLAVYYDITEFLENKQIERLTQAELINKLSLKEFDELQAMFNHIDYLSKELEEVTAYSVNITTTLKKMDKEGYI